MTSGLPAGVTGRNRLSLPHFSPDLWTAAMQYGTFIALNSLANPGHSDGNSCGLALVAEGDSVQRIN
jgi:hypothetical protein